MNMNGATCRVRAGSRRKDRKEGSDIHPCKLKLDLLFVKNKDRTIVNPCKRV